MDERRESFHRWLAKWHHIGSERGVEIDTFDGCHTRLSSVAFWGTPRHFFWDNLVKGVRKDVADQLAWVDTEVRNYNRATALRAIDKCAGQLVSFVLSIRRAATKKDRILRGDGTKFPPEDDAGRWEGLSETHIQAQADALKLALPDAGPAVVLTRTQRMLAVWNDNQWWLGPLAIIVGIAGVALPFLI
ncbi:MAG: hypothetical protein V4444_00120 [Pseudomonadota bacterium]